MLFSELVIVISQRWILRDIFLQFAWHNPFSVQSDNSKASKLKKIIKRLRSHVRVSSSVNSSSGMVMLASGASLSHLKNSTNSSQESWPSSFLSNMPISSSASSRLSFSPLLHTTVRSSSGDMYPLPSRSNFLQNHRCRSSISFPGSCRARWSKALRTSLVVLVLITMYYRRHFVSGQNSLRDIAKRNLIRTRSKCIGGLAFCYNQRSTG